MATLIRLSERDNVAVVTADVARGTALTLDDLTIIARDPIPFAHKIALRPIAAGEKVIKFGVPIGSAVVAIEPGAHVHVHNIQSDYVVNLVDHFEEATAPQGAAS